MKKQYQGIIIFAILLLAQADDFPLDSDGTLYDPDRNSIDPTKHDYCQNVCKKGIHSCCNYKPDGIRIERTERMDEFRHTTLDWLNEDRNRVALGEEKRPKSMGGSPPASNMMVLNYDLELEFIARCWAVSYEHKGSVTHDECKNGRNGEGHGQNLAAVSILEKNNDSVMYLTKQAKTWVSDEIEFINSDFLKKFTLRPPHLKPDEQVGHYSQVVWWSTTHVGCVRVDLNGYKNDPMRFWMVCNYGSTLYKHAAGNLMDHPVYKQGKACSECPGDSKCDTKRYPGLCGKLYKILSKELDTRESSAAVLKVNLTTMVVILILSMYYYTK